MNKNKPSSLYSTHNLRRECQCGSSLANHRTLFKFNQVKRKTRTLSTLFLILKNYRFYGVAVVCIVHLIFIKITLIVRWLDFYWVRCWWCRLRKRVVQCHIVCRLPKTEVMFNQPLLFIYIIFNLINNLCFVCMFRIMCFVCGLEKHLKNLTEKNFFINFLLSDLFHFFFY